MFTPITGVRVIGVGHKARQGKDTFARILTRIILAEGGPRATAVRYAFADALKAVARVEHGMTFKDGRLLQVLGTEVYRQGRTVVYDGRTVASARTVADDGVWLRALYYRIEEERPDVAIITDVRFPNETDLVKRMGGVTVRVRRPDAAGRAFVDPHRDPLHASETALDDYPWDVTIDNPEGNPTEFEQRIRAWWRARCLTEGRRAS